MKEYIIDINKHITVTEAGCVPLVRCKDCKWRGTNACFCKARDDVQDDWFCSEGERKEGR